MGAARDTGDGCFCHQRYLPRMIVPGFADHDPGPGIEGMGTGALRGAGRTRRAVTGATPGRGPAFTMPPGAPFPGVRATGWHANDRTRVLPRLTGQPEPRAVLARAPRDLPCSPREPCRPGERGPLLVTALLAAPMLLTHAVSERPPKPPPLRHGLPQADCAAWATAASPPARRRPGPGGAGYLARHAARGVPPRGPASKPPDLPAPRRCHRQDLAVNVQPAGQRNLNPAGPDSSAASAVRAIVTAGPGRRHISPNG